MIKRLAAATVCLLVAAIVINTAHLIVTASDIFGKLAVVAAAAMPAVVIATLLAAIIAVVKLRFRTASALLAVMGLGAAPMLAPIYPTANTPPHNSKAVTASGQPTLTFSFANMYKGGTRKRDIHFITAGTPTPDVVIGAETHFKHQRKVTKALHKTHRQVRVSGRFGAGETLSVWLKRKSHWTLANKPYTPLDARVFRLTLTHTKGNQTHTAHVIGLHARHPLIDTVAAWNHDMAATAATIKATPGPLLVVGDFNQPLTSPRLALWATKNNLTSCRTRREVLTQGTWASPHAPTKALISIDHVFTRDAHCGPISVLRLSRSDHRGLVGTITT